MSGITFPLWSDEPATQDLLAFQAVAQTAADSIFDDRLDPVAIGLSGSWGSGKTSVLELVKTEIESRSADQLGNKVLVIPTQPWRYDPAIGPKESLIAEVLAALADEFNTEDPVGKAGLDAFRKLVRKVNWSKAVKMATRTAITMQLPSVDDVFDLVNDDPESLDGEKGMSAFRDEFGKLLADPALAHLSRVVVLVDDLDRCLPDTVVETLEAIRLFLSAKGMSFIIAADEDRVAEAIQQKLNTAPPKDGEEDPARLYLHKIVQTTIPLPGLSHFDTQAYLFLLLAHGAVDEGAFAALVSQSDQLRRSGGSLDDLDLSATTDLAEHLANASRLTPILYEKFHGNPRRIKRFLNDLNVRQAVAGRRGIELPTDAVAKLMVLERLLPTDFETVVGWLASNELRDKLEALDRLANQATETPTATDAGKAEPKKGATAPKRADTGEAFTDTLIRWAKLPPVLDSSAVSGYLYLAASFVGLEVVDRGLPERLRDIASALTSTLKLDQASVTNEVLAALDEADARTLAVYLGRKTRDQPSLQKFTVAGMLRLSAAHPAIEPDVVSALKGLPTSEIAPATVLRLRGLDEAIYGAVLETWRSGNLSTEAGLAADNVRAQWSTTNGN